MLTLYRHSHFTFHFSVLTVLVLFPNNLEDIG